MMLAIEHDYDAAVIRHRDDVAAFLEGYGTALDGKCRKYGVDVRYDDNAQPGRRASVSRDKDYGGTPFQGAYSVGRVMAHFLANQANSSPDRCLTLAYPPPISDQDNVPAQHGVRLTFHDGRMTATVTVADGFNYFGGAS